MSTGDYMLVWLLVKGGAMMGLAAEHQASLLRLASKAPATGALALDPRDAEQRSLITGVLEASGKGRDRYPALHASIEQAAGKPQQPGGGADDCTIADLGQDSSGRASGRGWLSSRGKAFISGATVMVHDADGGALLASGTTAQVGGTLAQASTKTAQAQPASERMTAITLFHAQQSPDVPPRFGLVARSETTQSSIAITVNDPRITRTPPPPPKSPIKIGLFRTAAQMTDVDYGYIVSPATDPDRLVVPFTGNAVLASQIDTTRVIQLTTRLYVMSPKAYLNPLSSFNLLAGVSAGNNQVTWSYPFDGKTTPIVQTKSIQYEANQSANERMTAFLYTFTVPIQGFSNPTVTFSVCSEEYPNEPSINCQQIAKLEYWWHCLGEDTAVTLADGQGAPISDIDNMFTVRSGISEGTCRVEATSRAYHSDNDGRESARRLVTEGGSSLLASAGHPIVTPSGPVALRDLSAGMTVLTVRGEERIISCEEEPYEGIVYNLKLAAGERGFSSFLANGIVVGDHDAQEAHERATRTDPEYMLPRLPESHHQDYLSALADMSAS